MGERPTGGELPGGRRRFSSGAVSYTHLYSDGTSVLNAISARSGLETFYGQSPGTISRGNPYNLGRFTEMLMEGRAVYRKNSGWKAIRGGKASGELVGGYLLNFALLMEGEFFKVNSKKRYLLFLEDHICFNQPPAVSRYLSRCV